VTRAGVGDIVQTPLGKGVVREVRNNGRLLVEVKGRALIVTERDVAVADAGRRPRPNKVAAQGRSKPSRMKSRRTASLDVDLHGLTVEEALERAQQALNDALLADLAELRLIHGRSGGRIRAALHRRLRETPSVRTFRLDPRNEGVTIVDL
jgi:DNA mismatch repair protein MutS2